jgi:hypothetical protein
MLGSYLPRGFLLAVEVVAGVAAEGLRLGMVLSNEKGTRRPLVWLF